MVDTMSEIRTSSTRIADIIGIIEGIAFQTKIRARRAKPCPACL
ncbi:methyl-accepting chemotaxis protein [Paraburkholderia sp. Clong3]